MMYQYKHPEIKITEKTCLEILSEGLKADVGYSIRELVKLRQEISKTGKNAYEPCERCPLRKY